MIKKFDTPMLFGILMILLWVLDSLTYAELIIILILNNINNKIK